MLAASAALVLAAMLAITCQLQFDWLGGSLAAVMRNDPTAEGLDWTSLRARPAFARPAAAGSPRGGTQLARRRQDRLRTRARCDHAVPEFRLTPVRHRRSAARPRRTRRFAAAGRPSRTSNGASQSVVPNASTPWPRLPFNSTAACCEPSRSCAAIRCSLDHKRPRGQSQTFDFHCSAQIRAMIRSAGPDQTARPAHSRHVTPGSREADDGCTGHYRPA